MFTIAYWLFVGLSAIVLYVGALVLWAVTAPFDRERRLLHRYTCWWATLYLRILPGCRIDVKGRERIQPGVSYVIVANHQSMADIMALSSLAIPFKWVSKKETFRLPCIGWNMYLNEYVRVDRGNVRSVRDTMETCRTWLSRGISVLIFPEGHRSPDGAIHGFRGGAFKLAIDSRCPILPVVVDGTRPVYRGLRVQPFPGRITIRVLEPIATEGANPLQLREQTQELLKQELAGIRVEPRSAA